MKKFSAIALIATASVLGAAPSVVLAEEASQSVRAATDEATAAVEFSSGNMLYGSDGRRIARIYDVNRDGDAEVIISGQLYTIPASTLSSVDGKITSSLTKREVTTSR